MRRAIAIGLVALVATTTDVGASQRPRCAGRPLAAVLIELGAWGGINIVFSSLVVQPELTVVAEPRARSPRAMLDELLRAHGLQAVDGPGRSALVVRTPVVDNGRPEAPPAGRIKIGFLRPDGEERRPTSVVLRGPGGKPEVWPDGSVVIPSVPAGVYTLEARASWLESDALLNLAVPAGSTVEAAIDLSPSRDSIAKTSDLSSLTVVLSEGVRFREAVEACANPAPRAAPDAAIPVRPADVVAMPGVGRNVARGVQALAGVEGASELDSRLAVWGGGPDQNLTVMDGVEIHNPYRLQGLASAFGPEAVDSFHVSTAGFDARFGDRLSSVLVVRSRRGTESRTLAGAASLSLLDADLVVEGRLPGAQSGSWLLNARRTHFLLDVEGPWGVELPTAEALQTTISWEPAPGRRLSFSGLAGIERTDVAQRDVSGEDVRLRASGGTGLGVVRFESRLGPAILRTTAAFSGFQDSVTLNGRVDSPARRSPGDEGIQLAEVAYDREVAIRDWSFRQDVSLRPSPRHEVELGLEAHRFKTRWGWRVLGDRIDGPIQHTILALGPYGLPSASLPSELDSAPSYTRLAVWAQDHVAVSERVALQPGLRVDHSGLNGETTLSPRISATLRLDATTRVRGAAGVYYQSPGYEKLFHSDYFVDLSDSRRLGLRSERSVHGVLGVERDLAAGLSARFEAYVKGFSNLIVGRLETEGERLSRLERYDFPASLQREIPSAPQITIVPVNEGRGRALGIAVLLSKWERSPETRLSGTASYAYAVADRHAFGREFPFTYDRRHALAVAARYRLSRTLELASAFRVGTGYPITPPDRLRVAEEEDRLDRDGDGNRTELVPRRDASGRLVYTLDFGGPANLNSARLPTYTRLDARLTYRPHGAAGRFLLFVEAVNLLDSKSLGWGGYRAVPSASGKRPTFALDDELLIPFFAYAGLRLRF
jgi:hypothetical protein